MGSELCLRGPERVEGEPERDDERRDPCHERDDDGSVGVDQREDQREEGCRGGDRRDGSLDPRFGQGEPRSRQQHDEKAELGERTQRIAAGAHQRGHGHRDEEE